MARTPTSISVADLKKVLGAQAARELLELMSAAEGPRIHVTEAQWDRAVAWANGDVGGKGAGQAIPAIRKYFATEEVARKMFLNWIERNRSVSDTTMNDLRISA